MRLCLGGVSAPTVHRRSADGGLDLGRPVRRVSVLSAAGDPVSCWRHDAKTCRMMAPPAIPRRALLGSRLLN